MTGHPQVLPPSATGDCLYIVEFKGGRSEVFYHSVNSGGNPGGNPGNTPCSNTSNVSLYDTLGTWVIVEADRGEDCGFISGRVTHLWLKAHMAKLSESEKEMKEKVAEF